MTHPDIRALALIGAKVRRDELKAALAEAESTVRALQQVPTKRTAVKKIKRRKFTPQQKAAIMAQAKQSSVKEVAAKHHLNANQIYHWISEAKG